MSARVVNIASGLTLKAKSTAGVWRTLAEGDEVANGEEIRASIGAPQFDLTAYAIEQRVSGAWAPALTFTLRMEDGTSHFRQDKIKVVGDSTNSTATVTVTTDKGDLSLKDLLSALKKEQERKAAQFTYQGAKFSGIFSEIENTNELGEGGFGPETQGTITADRQQFATAGVVPQVGKLITWWDGNKYRIRAIEKDEVSFVFHVISSTQ